MLANLLVLVLSAGLNRARGDARWKPSWLKGRALFYVAPAMAALALIVHPWPVALAFGGGYAFWAVFGWGHILMRVGGLRPDRKPDAVERILLRLPGSILPVFARMLFILPGVIAVAWLTGRPEFWFAGPAFAAVTTVAYHVLFRPPAADGLAARRDPRRRTLGCPDPHRLISETSMLRTLIAGALTLALLTACVPRDDGMGDLWKGVSCVRKGTCR